MKRLIVNGDDFGLTHGVNTGIVRAYKEGILTSATLMANGDAFEGAVELACANPGLGVGCHLVAVGGRPVASATQIPSLVNNDGMLPATFFQLLVKLSYGAVPDKDIECEFRAQIDRIIASGITPTHLDSHKHSHTHPRVMRALARVAREFAITCIRNPFEGLLTRTTIGPAARARCRVYLKQYAMSTAVAPYARRFKRIAAEYELRVPENFRGARLTGLLDCHAICGLIETLTEGTTELMCHPGVYDEELERVATRLKRERQREVDALTELAVRRSIDECGVKLISYAELGREHV